jgi:hypothetical protein
MATTKETKKETKVVFEHRDNPYFLFTAGRLRCQFLNHKYETSNPVEIKTLRNYALNQSDVVREVK